MQYNGCQGVVFRPVRADLEGIQHLRAEQRVQVDALFLQFCQVSRLVQNSRINMALADIVQQCAKLDFLLLARFQAHCVRQAPGQPADPLRMAVQFGPATKKQVAPAPDALDVLMRQERCNFGTVWQACQGRNPCSTSRAAMDCIHCWRPCAKLDGDFFCRSV